jgi:unsaturated rhamnogalacturonyl hydrolase
MRSQRRVRLISRYPVLSGASWLFAAGALLWSAAYFASAQTGPLSKRFADTILQSGARDNTSWNEDIGLQLEGLDAAWYNTANGDYFRHVKAKVDAVLAADAPIGATGMTANTLFARQLLLLYRVTLDPKYYKAAAAIRAQLARACDSPSTSPDTICTAGPFLAEYASVFQEPEEFANITRGFEKWDRTAPWPSPKAEEANLKNTSIAWLAASLVDALPYYPEEDPERARLTTILTRIANTAAQHQNQSTGLFGKSSNSLPHLAIASSQACLLAYALAKGVRLGYLPTEDSKRAVKAWQALSKSYLNADSDFVPSPGSGALLLASTELDLAPTATLARGQTVLLDAWYNSQQRKNAGGQTEYFHYKWLDRSDSGYALLAHMFQSYGAATETLYSAPTDDSLRKSQYYIIVSPDIPVKNPNPHYMTGQDAEQIAAWVKDGGILILLENDPPNADLTHLNLLADKFGIHFDDVLHHHILGEHVEDGRMAVDGNGPLFHHPHALYMKDTCAISLSGPAVALFRDRGDVVMASAKYGRGTVFASVDPWLYNEYTDGRKKPEIYDQFDNFAGGQELVQWLLQRRPH